MKTTVLSAAFIYVIIVGFRQEKHYKNQINQSLTQRVLIEKRVYLKGNVPKQSTPRYQQITPNLVWEDTMKLKINPPSYKQHVGRPNK